MCLMIPLYGQMTDTDKEVKLIKDFCSKLDVKVSLCTHWSNGGKGTEDLSKKVVEVCKKNNKEKVKETQKNYLNSEVGYFKEMWNGIKKSKHGHDFKDFEDFFQCWLDQKAIHGMICPATGVTMTMIRRMTTCLLYTSPSPRDS